MKITRKHNWICMVNFPDAIVCMHIQENISIYNCMHIQKNISIYKCMHIQENISICFAQCYCVYAYISCETHVHTIEIANFFVSKILKSIPIHYDHIYKSGATN